MFGENDLLGVSIHSIDPKGRLFIPRSWTNVESEDEIIVCKENEDFFALYSKKKYLEKIKKLIQKEDKNPTNENIEMLINTVEKMNTCKVDNQLRITLPKELRKYSKIKLVGIGGKIILVPEEKRKSK